MNKEIKCRDQNPFLYQAENMFISVLKLGIFYHGGLCGLTHFWSPPQVAIQGAAVLALYLKTIFLEVAFF